MFNRKEIRSVLKEWKSFLAEAAKESAPKGPLIRIFDFDGTLMVYEDPEVNLIMKNPYMASFVAPEVMKKLNEREATLPKNIKAILKDTGPTTRNYIISKVSSVGMPKVKVDKLIAGLKNIELKDDKNFEALAKVVIQPVVPNWRSLLSNNRIEELLAKAASVLNIDAPDIPDANRLSANTSVMTQEEKIDQVLTRFKIQDKFTRVYTKDNIAKHEEVPMDGGGFRMKAIAGTSGKASPAGTIARNAFAEFPDTLLTFEVYDNSTSNVAEIEGAILKASSGDEEQAEEVASDMTLLRDLADELGKRENVIIKKFQAITVEGGVELRDLENIVISKSKSSKVDDIQESARKLKFQKLKNKFFSLMNFLKKGGSAGRPSTVTINALEKAVKEKTGDLVQELFANTISAIATTGLEDKYGKSDTELENLKNQLFQFTRDYQDFKSTFEANKSAAPVKTPKAPKAPKAAPAQEPTSAAQDAQRLRDMGDFDAADDLEADDDFDPAAAADSYSDDQMYADMADAEEQDRAAKAARKAKKPLKESFGRFKIVLKNRN